MQMTAQEFECYAKGTATIINDVRSVLQELHAANAELTAERDRLKANLDEAAKAHAAQYAENEALKKRLAEEQDAARRLERRMTALLDFLAELGLNDPLSSASFVAQVRENLAARDAAQQRAGAVRALRQLAAECGPARSAREWYSLRADAIERGEVSL